MKLTKVHQTAEVWQIHQVSLSWQTTQQLGLLAAAMQAHLMWDVLSLRRLLVWPFDAYQPPGKDHYNPHAVADQQDMLFSWIQHIDEFFPPLQPHEQKIHVHWS